MKSLAVALLLFATATAAADSKGLVTDALSAQLDPIAKVAPMAEREKQICANSKALLDTASAISSTKVPKGVPLDEITWRHFVGDVSAALDSINDLCKMPGHQSKGIGGKVTTLNDAMKDLMEAMPALVDAARPRTLPGPLAKLRASITALDWQKKSFCATAKTVVKQLGSVTRPDKADAAKWEAAVKDVKEHATGLQETACSKQKLAPEEVAGVPVELSASFYKLVMLVPAS